MPNTLCSRPPAEIGEIIAGYQLESIIGQGGMSTVYRARHVHLPRVAAVKVLSRDLAADPDFADRMFLEAQIVNAVRHENVVDIFDFVVTDRPRRIACVMELIEGPPLADVIAGPGLTVAQALSIGIQLTGALEMVHAAGVTHRDLKPGNILITGSLDSDLSEASSLKVLDFGIAKVAGEGDALRTATGSMFGTPAYMAPEQISGSTVTAAADVYAVGEILFEMLSGSRAFTEESHEILRAKLVGRVPDVILPGDAAILSPLRDLIARSLSSIPELRPSIGQIRLALLAARELLRVQSGPHRAMGAYPISPCRSRTPAAVRITPARLVRSDAALLTAPEPRNTQPAPAVEVRWTSEGRLPQDRTPRTRSISGALPMFLACLIAASCASAVTLALAPPTIVVTPLPPSEAPDPTPPSPKARALEAVSTTQPAGVLTGTRSIGRNVFRPL